MTMARAKGRNLESSHFHKELFCRVNLPPLHICKNSFVPNIVQQLLKTKTGNPRNFFRSSDDAAPSLINRLCNKTLSTSLVNYRKLVEEKNNIPLDIFVQGLQEDKE